MPLPRTPPTARSRFVALLLAVALAGLASAGASEDTAAAQAKEKDRRQGRKGPAELWELYPLNPLAGRQERPPSPAPSEAVGESPSDAVASRPITVEHAAERDEGGGLPWPALVAGGTVLVAAGWGLARRRRPALAAVSAPQSTPRTSPERRPEPAAGNAGPPAATRPPSPVGAGPARSAPAAPTSAPGIVDITDKTSGGAEGDPRAAQHVRVHLHDGRRIEGWKKDSRARDQKVLILDVETVYDPAGNLVGPTALDRFLLPPQIERIERLD